MNILALKTAEILSLDLPKRWCPIDLPLFKSWPFQTLAAQSLLSCPLTTLRKERPSWQLQITQDMFCYLSYIYLTLHVLEKYRLIHRQLHDDVDGPVKEVEVPPTEKGILCWKIIGLISHTSFCIVIYSLKVNVNANASWRNQKSKINLNVHSV